MASLWEDFSELGAGPDDRSDTQQPLCIHLGVYLGLVYGWFDCIFVRNELVPTLGALFLPRDTAHPTVLLQPRSNRF